MFNFADIIQRLQSDPNAIPQFAAQLAEQGEPPPFDTSNLNFQGIGLPGGNSVVDPATIFTGLGNGAGTAPTPAAAGAAPVAPEPEVGGKKPGLNLDALFNGAGGLSKLLQTPPAPTYARPIPSISVGNGPTVNPLLQPQQATPGNPQLPSLGALISGAF